MSCILSCVHKISKTICNITFPDFKILRTVTYLFSNLIQRTSVLKLQHDMYIIFSWSHVIIFHVVVMQNACPSLWLKYFINSIVEVVRSHIVGQICSLLCIHKIPVFSRCFLVCHCVDLLSNSIVYTSFLAQYFQVRVWETSPQTRIYKELKVLETGTGAAHLASQMRRK